MTRTNIKIVIVGGVAGGATAAARARRANANAEITVLEKGTAVSFANCGLPYHLGGEIEDRGKLLVATKELFWNRFRIGVCTEHNVQQIDRNNQNVIGVNAQGDQFQLPYDKLILATGSEPIRPEFCKIAADNLFQLWTLADMDGIIAYLKKHNCRTATVVGAGFVGLEVVEQLHRLGLQVALVEKLPQVLGPLDAEMAKLVQLELEKHKVAVHLDATVSKLATAGGRVTEVQLADGKVLSTELVIVGAGVRPRTELAVGAGLSIGKKGGVIVNEYCQTSDPKIYAVGDMIEYFHGTLGQYLRMPLAGPANRSGRIAGSHAACGESAAMSPVQGTAIVRVFNLSAGLTGLSERTCKSHNIECHCATIQAPHHASYFPGSKNLTIKLIYSPVDGRVLGAQVVGAEGVDKRLDVVATLLQFKGDVDDLAGLDLAYAPPFGSAKDPIHMAAFVAQNDLSGFPTLAAFDAELAGLQVVDVRNANEIEKMPLTGALHIPVDELVSRWESLDPKKPTIVVCHSGKRAHVAACWLKGKGFENVCNLNGGMSIRMLS
jgi:NADPH-dependent 2,4-dienoyl-CoA reductase/sulfur reductase-like enzyme/rhodanese-related sulfurtransferase